MAKRKTETISNSNVLQNFHAGNGEERRPHAGIILELLSLCFEKNDCCELVGHFFSDCLL